MTYRVGSDGRVWDARGRIEIPVGFVAPFNTGGRPRGAEHWLPLDLNGKPIAGPSRVRTLSAMTVIRHHGLPATLLDIVEEEPCA